MKINRFAKRTSVPVAEATPDCPPSNKSAKDSGRRRKRRGVTSLEYLVALSLIIIVVIVAVQHLGQTTNTLLTNSANATKPKS